MNKTLITIFIILAILSVIFGIGLAITYGNKPISDVPFWVLWFMS